MDVNVNNGVNEPEVKHGVIEIQEVKTLGKISEVETLISPQQTSVFESTLGSNSNQINGATFSQSNIDLEIQTPPVLYEYNFDINSLYNILDMDLETTPSELFASNQG